MKRITWSAAVAFVAVVAGASASTGAAAAIAFDSSSRFTPGSARILDGGGTIARGASLAPRALRLRALGLLARGATLSAGMSDAGSSGLLSTFDSGVPIPEPAPSSGIADNLPTPPRLMDALLLFPDAGAGYAFDALDRPRGTMPGASATHLAVAGDPMPGDSIASGLGTDRAGAPSSSAPSPWLIGATSLALIGLVLSRRRAMVFGYRVVLVEGAARGG